MADVARGERAQLLIVSAIGLAILLTALALALHTAASAGTHVAESDNGLHETEAAIGYQASAERAVAGLMAENNTTESDLRAAVEDWNELISAEYARDGVVTDVSVADTTVENRIVQDDTRNFTDRSGTENWTVASNATQVEGYEMELEASDLSSSDDCAASGECFTLTVEDDDGDAWRLFASNPSENETIEMTVQTANGSTDTCTAEASSAPVNVTDGVFTEESGAECSFTSFTEDGEVTGPYTLRYEGTTNVTGTYTLTVTGNVVEGSIEDDERYATTGSPRIHPDIRSANVSISYRSPELTYHGQIRVVPGETDD
ncbi:hypothetical protein [Halobellus ordinarius]|uniref:hypothetical protein n=1 Tax=Halobellus ordinarius TaxID=3075120 RepID=UPI00288085AB|nr:hypothetical protein [Halobellus sp. ZY16]